MSKGNNKNNRTWCCLSVTENHDNDDDHRHLHHEKILRIGWWSSKACISRADGEDEKHFKRQPQTMDQTTDCRWCGWGWDSVFPPLSIITTRKIISPFAVAAAVAAIGTIDATGIPDYTEPPTGTDSWERDWNEKRSSPFFPRKGNEPHEEEMMMIDDLTQARKKWKRENGMTWWKGSEDDVSPSLLPREGLPQQEQQESHHTQQHHDCMTHDDHHAHALIRQTTCYRFPLSFPSTRPCSGTDRKRSAWMKTESQMRREISSTFHSFVEEMRVISRFPRTVSCDSSDHFLEVGLLGNVWLWCPDTVYLSNKKRRKWQKEKGYGEKGWINPWEQKQHAHTLRLT